MTKITTPRGTSGLAVAPWSSDEVYAVAADWAQASAPVWALGRRGWDITGLQVADYRHRPKEALYVQLYDAIRASGDEPDEEELDRIMQEAYYIDDK